MRDLNISFEESGLAKNLSILHAELQKKGLKVKPLIWGSDDWFCPDDHTSFAVPFTLFHPRLTELEKDICGEVEGDSRDEFLKLCRHECGHIVDNAYLLREIAGRVELFGDHNQAYPQDYTFKKYSKKFVRHLSENYAQAHPEEDWSETFAVWLTPGSAWRSKYEGWGALRKLNYVNSVMKQLKNKRVSRRNDFFYDHFKSLDMTFGEYLKQKKKLKSRKFKFSQLRAINISEGEDLSLALKENRKEIIDLICSQTKIKKYDLTYVLKDLELNARKKGLRINKRAKKMDVLNHLVIGHAKTFLSDGKHRIIM